MVSATDNKLDINPARIKGKRDKLPGLFISREFFADPKVRRVRRKYGAAGPMAVLEIWLTLAGERNCEIHRDAAIDIIVGHFDESKSVEVLNFLIEVKLLTTFGNDYLTNQIIIDDLENFEEKRRVWREKYESKKRVKGESEQGSTRSTLNHEYRSLKDDPEDPNPKEGGAGETNSPTPESQGRKQFLTYVWLNEIEYSMYEASLGVDKLRRCIEKLNGWIGQDPNNPDKLKAGKNAAFTFKNWVIRAVEKEFDEDQTRAERKKAFKKIPDAVHPPGVREALAK
jgi:hypothetical protein